MENPDLRILIADDDEDDVILIRELAQEGILDSRLQFDWAENAEKAYSLIQNGNYHICLMDYRLGESNGLDLLRKIRKQGISVPIIFLTGRGDEGTAAEAIKSGATDYLIKGSLSPEILSHAIRQAIKLHEERDERRKAEQALTVQDRLLQAVSDANNCLLTRRNHKEAIREVLKILCSSTHLAFGKIYQLQDTANGSRRFLQCFSWNNESETTAGSEDFFQAQTCGDFGLEPFLARLEHGEIIEIAEEDLPVKAKEIYQRKKIKSIIVVPIIIDEIFWGFLAFGDSDSQRKWTANQSSLLKAVAASIGCEIRRHNEDAAFYSIVEGTSSRVGDDFFQSLAHHLALALPARRTYVSEMISYNSSECSILAGWEDGTVLNNQLLNVKNTPYEEVLAGMVSYHADAANEKFSGNACLAGLNIKSYAAVPCFDSNCKIIGHLSVMDDKPMLNKERTLSILKIFAARAGAELERKRTESMIRNMAYHDALTGLPNRILLNDRLEMALAQAQRGQNMLAVLFLDFDHFKAINDNLGHAVGDLLLKSVAGRLKKCLRNQDTVARLGGDEFILLLPEINSPLDAGHLAKKLLDVVRFPFHIQEHELNITFSIGVALYPRDGENSTTLLKHADEALYLAKKNGKNCFQFYNAQQVEAKK